MTDDCRYACSAFPMCGCTVEDLHAPQRIQLRRTKGWRMPPNTVKVDRTTRFGNFFIPGQDNPFLPGRKVADRRHAFVLFRAHAPLIPKLVAAAQAELRGKNLACWCAIGKPCHADTLMELANA